MIYEPKSMSIRLYILFVIVIPLEIDSFYGVYHTNRYRNIDKYDCLRTDQTGDQDFIIEYCRRPIDIKQMSSNVHEKVKCQEDLRTFEEMRSNRVTGNYLLLSFAPIDVIDQYEIYLENWNESYVRNSEDYFCNCTNRELQAFGRNCEYVVSRKLTEKQLEDLSDTAKRTNYIFSKLDLDLYLARKESSEVTQEVCYRDLPGCRTLSGLCLQWNEICNGEIDCENGEDEMNCLLLELHQCHPINEYRCRNGMCISRSMAFNFQDECDDWTDEGHYLPKNDLDTSRKVLMIEFGDSSRLDHFCGWGWFSCGNGQCSKSLWTRAICFNKRDMHHVRRILQPTSIERQKIACWTFAICLLGFTQFFQELQISTCLSVTCNQTEFLFPSEHPIAHPSVYLLYHTNRSFEYSINPDYICYDAFACRNVYQPTIFKQNRSCNRWREIINDFKYTKQNWTRFISDIRQAFMPCLLPKPDNVNDSLFDCGPILISKHRLYDKHIDCLNNKDELDGHETCHLGVAQRFQCSNDPTKCMPRIQLLDRVKDCPDGTDEVSSYYQLCGTPNDDSCRWRRGTLPYRNVIKFNTLCDGFVDDVLTESETDESDCPLIWKRTCNTTRKRCDFFWHCQDGQDEIGCSYNDIVSGGIPFECTKRQQFYCVNRITKQLGCYSSAMAGDGHEDCVGAIDERIGGFCQSKYPLEKKHRFRCGQSDLCISVDLLCDGIFDCSAVNNTDDEILCPWRQNLSLNAKSPSFMCKDQTIFPSEVRCNDRYECVEGEDELFCFLTDPPEGLLLSPEVQSIITDIIAYPYDIFPSDYQNPTSRINSLRQLSQQTIIHSSIMTQNNKTCANDWKLILAWYCNGGLVVSNSTFLSQLFCLCPYSHYGERCEFQRRRVRINVKFLLGDQYWHKYTMYKLAIYLINAETYEIFDYSQQTFIIDENLFEIRREINSFRSVELLFPVNISFLIKSYVQIDAFIINGISLKYEASWYYDLMFPFLPVQSLSMEVFLSSPTPVVGSCRHGQRRLFANQISRTWCHCHVNWRGAECDQPDSTCQSNPCSMGSICVPNKKNPICLCTLYQQGPTCRVPRNPLCLSNPCRNNGTCFPRFVDDTLLICLCPEDFTGQFCEIKKKRLVISVEDDLIEKHAHVPAMIIHLNYILHAGFDSNMYTSHLRLLKNVQLSRGIQPLFVKTFKEINFGFVQLFTNPSDSQGQYFLILTTTVRFGYDINVSDPAEVNTTIVAKNRCPNVKEIFNSTILSMKPLQRAKFYHEPCQNNHQLVCFFDEQLMCLCNRYRMTHCFMFLHRISDCNEKHQCLNNGRCLQENDLVTPFDYICICEECYFGDLCQFTTSQYSISLDSLIGQTIKTDVTFKEQPATVIVSLIVVLILIILGFLFNGFTIVLFIRRKKCRETGSSLYILFSSLFGVLSLCVLGLKLISLVFNIIMSKQFGCILIEYLLKSFPSIVDWMNTFVSLERFWVARKKISFQKKKSKKLAKLLIPLTIVVILATHLHDPFHRESVVDPRLDYGRRAWCVVHFKTATVRLYNIIINIIHYIVPFLLSLVATIFILIDFARTRAKAKKQAFQTAFKEQLSTLKHWIISPIILVILALPRIIFSLTFTCIPKEAQWQISLLIMSYFLAFLPHMSSLIIFVFPSKTYMKEFKDMLLQMGRRL